MPDRRAGGVTGRPRLPGQPCLGQACLRARIAAVLVCFFVCALLLPLGGCGVTVKPSGQVVTGISLGRQ